MAGPIRISILANASQAKKEVGGLGSTFKKSLGVAGVAIGGAAVVAGVKSLVTAASDAQQSLGGTQAVFGKYADKVVKDSDRAASAFGLSANQYRESANLIGSLLKNQGVSQDKLGSSTKNLVRTGADLAATYGGTAASAVEALGSAFKGEFDPLQQYGITLKQSTINTEAMRLAHVKTTSAFGKLSAAQQQSAQRQATQNLIAKQSTDAQGQFQKQTSTLAEQQQILSAKIENLKSKLGSFLLPIITKVIEYVTKKGLPALQDFGSEMSDKLGPAVDAVKGALENIQPIISTVIDFIKKNPKTVEAFAIVLGVLAAAVGVATAAVAAFDAVLAINPITLIVIALAAFAAAMVYAYTHSKTFAAVVNTAFGVIKAIVPPVVSFVVDFVKKHWGLLLALFGGPIGLATVIIIKNFDKIKAAIRILGGVARWLWNNAFQPAIQFIVRGVGLLISIWAKMLGALGHLPGFGWAKDASKAMQGAADAAQRIADNLHKIPGSTSADVIINVVKHMNGTVYGTGGHVPNDPSSKSNLLPSNSKVSVQQRTYNLNVSVPVGGTEYDTGEAIVSAIRAYETAVGAA